MAILFTQPRILVSGRVVTPDVMIPSDAVGALQLSIDLVEADRINPALVVTAALEQDTDRRHRCGNIWPREARDDRLLVALGIISGEADGFGGRKPRTLGGKVLRVVLSFNVPAMASYQIETVASETAKVK